MVYRCKFSFLFLLVFSFHRKTKNLFSIFDSSVGKKFLNFFCLYTAPLSEGPAFSSPFSIFWQMENNWMYKKRVISPLSLIRSLFSAFVCFYSAKIPFLWKILFLFFNFSKIIISGRGSFSPYHKQSVGFEKIWVVVGDSFHSGDALFLAGRLRVLCTLTFKVC